MAKIYACIDECKHVQIHKHVYIIYIYDICICAYLKHAYMHECSLYVTAKLIQIHIKNKVDYTHHTWIHSRSVT